MVQAARPRITPRRVSPTTSGYGTCQGSTRSLATVRTTDVRVFSRVARTVSYSSGEAHLGPGGQSCPCAPVACPPRPSVWPPCWRSPRARSEPRRPLPPTPSSHPDADRADLLENPRPTYGEAYTLSGPGPARQRRRTPAPPPTRRSRSSRVNLDLCASACTGTLAAPPGRTVADGDRRVRTPRRSSASRWSPRGPRSTGSPSTAASTSASSGRRRKAIAVRDVPSPGRGSQAAEARQVRGPGPSQPALRRAAGHAAAQEVREAASSGSSQNVVTSSRAGYFTFRLARPRVTSQYVVRARASDNLELSYRRSPSSKVRPDHRPLASRRRSRCRRSRAGRRAPGCGRRCPGWR